MPADAMGSATATVAGRARWAGRGVTEPNHGTPPAFQKFRSSPKSFGTRQSGELADKLDMTPRTVRLAPGPRAPHRAHQ